MKLNLFHLVSLFATSTNALSFQALPTGVINLSSSQERDVYTMVDWAPQCGVQQTPGVGVYTNDGKDYFAATEADIAAGSPVVCVPDEMVMSSTKVAQEFGGSLSESEAHLIGSGLQDKIPCFDWWSRYSTNWNRARILRIIHI